MGQDKIDRLVQATLHGLEPHKTKILLGYKIGLHTVYESKVTYDSLIDIFDEHAPDDIDADDIDNIVDYIMQNKAECCAAIVKALEGSYDDLEIAFEIALSL